MTGGLALLVLYAILPVLLAFAIVYFAMKAISWCRSYANGNNPEQRKLARRRYLRERRRCLRAEKRRLGDNLLRNICKNNSATEFL